MSNLFKFSIRLVVLSIAFMCYSYSHAQKPVITFPASGSFDVSKFTLVQWISVSEQGSSPEGIVFDEDGSNLFLSGFGSSERIMTSNLSTSFDISMAVYTGSDNDFLAEEVVRDLEFNADGSKLFGVSRVSVYEYQLSENYDVTSAVFAGLDENLLLVDEMQGLFAFEFNSDGTKGFALGSVANDYSIFEYRFSVAYDVSTATYEGEAERFPITELSNPRDFAFSPDGTMMFLVDFRGSTLLHYRLGTAFDVSSATYLGESEDFSLDEAVWRFGYPDNFTFDRDGLRLYALSGDRVFEYGYTDFVDYEENSTEVVIDIQANDGAGGENDTGITYRLLGTDAAFFQIDGLGRITFESSPNFERPQDLDADNVYEVQVRVDNGVDVLTRPVHIRVQDVLTPVFTKIGTAYNLPLGEYAGGDERFDLSSEEVDPTALEFNDDGTKMFVLGIFNQSVIAYDLSVPYDVSTAQHAGASAVFPITNQESFPTDLAFNNDGTKMFVVGADGDAVVEYTLGTGYDVSTAQYAGALEEFPVKDEDEGPTGIAFNPGGTQLFVLGTEHDAIFTYNLATSFDVSTASYAGASQTLSVAGQSTDPRDFTFSVDGKKLFFSGSDTDAILTYNLTEAFDVTSATLTGSSERLVISNEETAFTSLAFDNLGSKVYVVGGEATVFEYTLTSTENSAILVPYIENETTAVLDIDANDGNGGVPDLSVIYHLIGDDASQFEMDENGVISFVEPPNFEDPQDTDGNNTYIFAVIATNGFDDAERVLVIDILDEDDTPVITNPDKDFDFTHLKLSDTLLAQRDPFGIAFSQNGRKMYLNSVVPNTTNESAVFEYDLKRPFDLSSTLPLDFNQLLSISARERTPTGVFISNDGDRLFVSGTRGNVNQIDLEVPFDVTSASPLRAVININSPSGEARGLAFSSDGLKVYSAGFFNRTISEVELALPFDLSSSTGSRKTLSVSDVISGVLGLAFDHEGKRLYVTGSATRIARYDLGTAFDITTAQYSGLQISMDLTPIGMALNPEGSKLFITGSNKQNQRIIEEYVFPWRIDYLANETQPVVDIEANDGLGGANDRNLTYRLSGVDAAALEINATSGVITFKTAPDFNDPQDENRDNVYEFTVIVANGKDITEQLMVIHVIDRTPPTITSDAEIAVGENVVDFFYEAVADEAVTFSLGEDKDAPLFQLEASSIRFLEAPDFENPKDANADNVYVLDLMAVDASQNSSMIELTIQVTDVDEDLPVITSASSIVIPQGIVGRIYEVTANEPVAFELGEMKDEKHFQLVEDALSVTNPLEFNNPIDTNFDNVYLVDLIATDLEGNQAVFELSVNVAPALGVRNEIDNELIYPNPAKTFFSIEERNGLQVIQKVSVLTLSGLEVKAFAPEGNTRSFNIADLANGVYVVVIKTDNIHKKYGILIKN